MVKLIVRLVINAAALWIAAYIVPGISITENIGGLALVALVFGVVNAFIKPIVTLLTCPLNILTLGLFTLVINALMLLLTAAVVSGISVEGFLPALLGGLVVSIASTLLSTFLVDED